MLKMLAIARDPCLSNSWILRMLVFSAKQYGYEKITLVNYVRYFLEIPMYSILANFTSNKSPLLIDLVQGPNPLSCKKKKKDDTSAPQNQVNLVI